MPSSRETRISDTSIVTVQRSRGNTSVSGDESYTRKCMSVSHNSSCDYRLTLISKYRVVKRLGFLASGVIG